MSEVTEYALIGLTAVLSGATIALAYHTRQLVKVTREVGQKTEERETEPHLIFQEIQSLSDSNGKFVRLSVKNIGAGHAYNPLLFAEGENGNHCETKPFTRTNIVEKETPFYWDIYGVKKDEIVNFTILYESKLGKVIRLFLKFKIS